MESDTITQLWRIFCHDEDKLPTQFFFTLWERRLSKCDPSKLLYMVSEFCKTGTFGNELSYFLQYCGIQNLLPRNSENPKPLFQLLEENGIREIEDFLHSDSSDLTSWGYTDEQINFIELCTIDFY